MNKRALGNRNKNKTIKWLIGKGYNALNCELNKICYFGGRLVAVHKDLLGADCLCWNDKEFILIQCKTSKTDVSKARKEFEKYKLPDFIKKWVVLWRPRAKEPKITECGGK